MKIDGLTGALPGTGTPSEGRGVRNNARSASGESSTLHLSPLSAQMQALDRHAGSAETFNAAGVAGIRQAIAEGRLQVDPEVVADRLLDAVRELLQVQARPAGS